MLEKPAMACLEVGVAAHALVPQSDSGDAWILKPVPGGFVVAAIDGLGHGREAARASGRAVAAISASAGGTPEDILRACHQALIGTRGAAISIACINVAEQRLAWLGVGNVEGVLRSPLAYRGSIWPSEVLVVRGGVVGYELPHLQSAHLPFGLGAVLVFATDGIKEGFSSEIQTGRHPQHIADQIMAGYDRGTDDALVLVVRRVWGSDGID